MEINARERQENRLLRNTLFVFFVSGAASQPLGSFIPFLRETYGHHPKVRRLILSPDGGATELVLREYTE